MPRASTTKFKDEHHIFVKNVPADLGTAAVPNLFEHYKPTRIKNVYPTSNITTIVVTFATHEEAQQAQEDIDGMRLEHVVLRVEMYNKRRSIRYLKETRNTHRPHQGYVEEEDYDEDYEEEYETEYKEEVKRCAKPVATYALPFGPARQDSPTTWARIVGKSRGTGMDPLPAPAVSAQSGGPSLMNGAECTEQSPEVAMPHQDNEAASTDHSSADVLSPSSETSSSTDAEPDQKTPNHLLDAKPDTAVRASIFVPWESFNSTKRIVQRHCRDCAFCKKRLA
ncbi:hypothetical protein DE146DRAFT_285297 [Phaeosphaeria sp. MPI-PUGE-AT-0046c]|nr:hypothetical protein DE146DRAFT_285297 [Phaeosphaeria sp. MPI-PUGE-AT-0046c]